MNEFLNNVFTAESVEAIKNAHTISPSPEQKEEVKYNELKVEHAENEAIPTQKTESPQMNQDMQQVEQRLLQKVDEQGKRISLLINSQNEMIKEFNALCEKVKQIEQRRPEAGQQAESSAPQAPAEKPKGSQQTGAGEGLNHKDYSVEDIFYFGNKK